MSNKQKGRRDNTRDPRISWFITGPKSQFDQRACDKHIKLSNECWCRGDKALHDRALPEFQKCTLTQHYLGHGRWSEDDPEDRPAGEESA